METKITQGEGQSTDGYFTVKKGSIVEYGFCTDDGVIETWEVQVLSDLTAYSSSPVKVVPLKFLRRDGD